MGKKRIVKQSEEEILKEGDKIEAKVKKEVKGSKKATPFAASKVAEAVSQIAEKIGVEKIDVLVRGIGSGRESAIRSLAARGLQITSIKDTTPVPHNGCRPPKARRV